MLYSSMVPGTSPSQAEIEILSMGQNTSQQTLLAAAAVQGIC